MKLDAPISHLDLLVCRNTLMYFSLATQTYTLSRFYFALKDEGTLFLGRAETPFTRSSLFAPVHLKHRLFSKVPIAIRHTQLRRINTKVHREFQELEVDLNQSELVYQELHRSLEELEAMNEEFHSCYEELEIANEELKTLNDEIPVSISILQQFKDNFQKQDKGCKQLFIFNTINSCGLTDGSGHH